MHTSGDAWPVAFYLISRGLFKKYFRKSFDKMSSVTQK